MAATPRWHVQGDWFDVCRCSVPCPCTFAQRPTEDDCDGILAWQVARGQYGDVKLDGLRVVALASFRGNIWAGETKATMGMFMDARATPQQLDALGKIFGGQVGGFPAEFAKLIGEVRGMEVAPIEFEVAKDLSRWRVEVKGKGVVGEAEALTGPMTPPGKRVQTLNAPGSETGPGTVATWGRALVDKVKAMGFAWDRAGRSSKHIPFDWSGP
jgi:hypothetical protein